MEGAAPVQPTFIKHLSWVRPYMHGVDVTSGAFLKGSFMILVAEKRHSD